MRNIDFCFEPASCAFRLLNRTVTVPCWCILLHALKTGNYIYRVMSQTKTVRSAREVCCHAPCEPQAANSHCLHRITRFSALYSLCICSCYVSQLHLPCPCGQTDRQTDMMKLTVAFRNFANAPKNQSVNVVWGNNRCLFSDPHKTHNLNNI